MKAVGYNFTITQGALLHEETSLLIESLRLEDIFNEKYHFDFSFLPQNSEASRKTKGAQIVHRVRATKWKEIWETYPASNLKDQKLICFYSMCCRFNLLRDFMIEVYRYKWLNMKSSLNKDDVNHFLELKADLKPELNTLQEITKSKIAQVIFLSLKEVELIVQEKISDAPMSDYLREMFQSKGENWYLEIINIT